MGHLPWGPYPDATTLTITADCGGSNGNRTRLWKIELQVIVSLIGVSGVTALGAGLPSFGDVAEGVQSLGERVRPQLSDPPIFNDKLIKNERGELLKKAITPSVVFGWAWSCANRLTNGGLEHEARG